MGIPRVALFKCVKGHLSEVESPPGVPINEDDDEMPCPQCLMSKDVQTAYLIDIVFKTKWNGEKRK